VGDRNAAGQSFTEYALLLMIAAIVLLTVFSLGSHIGNKVACASNGLAGQTTCTSATPTPTPSPTPTPTPTATPTPTPSPSPSYPLSLSYASDIFTVSNGAAYAGQRLVLSYDNSQVVGLCVMGSSGTCSISYTNLTTGAPATPSPGDYSIYLVGGASQISNTVTI
jgi:Flp pilus assembly pilin Flp